MAQPNPRIEDTLARHDPVWTRIREEANAIVEREPQLAGFIFETILNHDTLEDAIAHRICSRLDDPAVRSAHIRRAFEDAYSDDPAIREAIRVDIAAVFDRDPACNRYIEPVLYFKGFHALQTHRLAHWLWRHNREDFAFFLQSKASEVYQVDMHPAVPLGRGIFFDHATSIVVGSTAVIEDEVSILQGVTLGGTGKESGDRHPKIRFGVLIGAGAKVLGNLEIGCCSRIAAGSVVLKPVPPHVTVAGVPAKIVGQAGCAEPSIMMDQTLADRDGSGDSS